MARNTASEMAPANALADLVGAFKPLAWRRLESEIRARIARVPTELNGYGFDRYGLYPDDVARAALPGTLLYRHYFKVETHDIERVPAGRVLLIANHAGQLPFDAVMLGMAMLLEAEPPRICRGMAEYWVSELPFVNVLATRMGSMVGTPRNCVSMLENDECVMVFPERVRGMNKTWKERYRLQRFGTGFMRLALRTGTPIVPIGIVGSEEQQPGLANWRGLARLLGMPAFPITPTFPWLGPLGLLPLPVKYHLCFGEPLVFEGSDKEEDRVIEEQVAHVRDAVMEQISRGLVLREGIFS